MNPSLNITDDTPVGVGGNGPSSLPLLTLMKRKVTTEENSLKVGGKAPPPVPRFLDTSEAIDEFQCYHAYRIGIDLPTLKIFCGITIY